ncbi:dual OB domain-containing protein [Stenotrophomonas maltophilia]|uniref:dual OB domain-containing protein n=1 Tax=Stenotrophomonas maltophilia TaxID=40324 RepID=UPI0013FE3BCD|nr:hypothetical protein [Stenotrophomonas maltophilia]
MNRISNFVCLANSKKFSGRCIAGKMQDAKGNWVWVRPVGGAGGKEITEDDRKYNDGSGAQVLDIINIVVKQVDIHPYQSENVIIDSGYYWTKVGGWPVANLQGLIDSPGALWELGDSSTSGLNDRVGDMNLKAARQTLFLIEPQALEFSVGVEGAVFGGNKRKVRAWFNYRGVDYGLAVTDPILEAKYLAGPDGQYQNSSVKYMTVSLGEPFNGHAYKLVAAVF